MRTETRVKTGMIRKVSTCRLPAVLFVCAMVSGGCGGAQREGSAQGEDGVEGFTRVVNVEVVPVEPRPFTRVIRLTGVATAMRDVLVSAQESGVVRRIVREKGERIRAGQAILRLDDAILSAQVQAATAQAAYAEEVWERRKKLYEEDGVGSELAYQEARYAAEESRANLAALRERLARTVVSAPISGVLDARLVELGAMVSPGTAVARIVQADSVKIMAGVPERYALDLAAGASASVGFDVLPGELFEGSIVYAGVTVDPENRTFPIELTIANPGGSIKPGMVASISVVQEELTDAIVAPRQALVSLEDGHMVFVVDESGGEARAAGRRVRISLSQGNDAVLEAGLEAGDRLIVVGQQGLTDGDRVRVVPGASGEGAAW
ncbi:MAG: efflux RND transporter periplasmic adaptor subunit [Gemmatimonadetes bacterium]|nr:efflux RND transporter periplasmic adaptor subunit [Gemmatimonadota bacterium]MYE94824.1 efflux RND transporter periplasmic adaptor subunit [Gemmatimonadota bacterium]MYJ10294.1 efflux RND transporter periplasmic adaptor subunit [Gemmatimonadota bacterium]